MENITYKSLEGIEAINEHFYKELFAAEKRHREPRDIKLYAFSLNDIENRAIPHFSLYDSKTGRNPIIDG